MPATLKVTHAVSVVWDYHRGPFEVVVDGKRVGSVERRETFEAPVEPGRHTLQVRTGRFSSRTAAFDAAEDETIGFRCHGGRLWPMLLASLVVPSLALKLNRE
jgi:hypothetical protein